MKENFKSKTKKIDLCLSGAVWEFNPGSRIWIFSTRIRNTELIKNLSIFTQKNCAAGFALLNLPKGKSLGRSKPETTSSNEQAH